MSCDQQSVILCGCIVQTYSLSLFLELLNFLPYLIYVSLSANFIRWLDSTGISLCFTNAKVLDAFNFWGYSLSACIDCNLILLLVIFTWCIPSVIANFKFHSPLWKLALAIWSIRSWRTLFTTANWYWGSSLKNSKDIILWNRQMTQLPLYIRKFAVVLREFLYVSLIEPNI